MKKIGVLLAGSGVYDGSEIQETVFTLLAIDGHGAEAVCFAPDMDQHHVINHLTGAEVDEKRNILVESARIARGNIQSLTKVDIKELDALFIPGGFGAAKNINKWALSGPDGDILPRVKEMIIEFIKAGKPIGAICMGPTVIAKALERSEYHAHLTVGTTEAKSPYDIAAISSGMESIGAIAEMKTIKEITIDEELKIVSAPCYMMEASISEILNNVKQTVDAVFNLM